MRKIMVGFIGIVCASSLIIAADGIENLLKNSSFEEKTDGKPAGWKGGGSLTDVEKKTGETSISFSNKAPSIDKDGTPKDWVKINAYSDEVPVKLNETYRAEVWVKIPAALDNTKRGFILNMVGYDKDKKVVAGWEDGNKEVHRVDATKDWEKIEMRQTINKEEIDTIKLRIGMCGVGTVYVDDVVLVKEK